MSLVQARGDVLPASTSEFIGRETELDRLGALLDGDARLITLVGPGGIGKTRLAAEALRRGAPARRRPVYWARLAALEADSTATAQDVMQSAVRTDPSSPPTRAALVRTFTSGDRSVERAILVLDNCEHLLGAVAAMIAELLEAAPGLTILATSREPIGWVDEYILAVPPLSPRQSLELFRQRAELIGRAIPDEREQTAVAARICRRVDHNPLFIRLAAARLRHQPPVMVLRELSGDADDKRLHWTHGARAGAEQRHRGVYDVVAWSFALCSPSEQLLLERLSVFAAGYETDDESLRGAIELDAAIAVCADDILPAREIEHLLERLTEQSLLSSHLTATTVSW
ncbi:MULTISPECIES: ATP-binding protein [Nocardia]|nr:MULTISPECIES: AAA family ATPase [Nocardia]